MSIGKTRKNLRFTKKFAKMQKITPYRLTKASKRPLPGGKPQQGEGMRGSFSKQRGGQITVAGVGQQDDDVLAGVLGALCQLDGGPDSSTGGDATRTPSLCRSGAGGKGVVIFDVMISS